MEAGVARDMGGLNLEKWDAGGRRRRVEPGTTNVRAGKVAGGAWNSGEGRVGDRSGIT